MNDTVPRNSNHASRQQRSQRVEAHLRKVAHKERCCALPAMHPGEAERLIAAFVAARGVTQCPTLYAVAVQ